MVRHRHKAQAKRRTMSGYRGTALGAHESRTGEVRAAHGAVRYLDVCACGATRETNRNGHFTEIGTWTEPARVSS